MRKVKLTAITRRALNKLKQHGNIWDVIMIGLDHAILRSLELTFQVGIGRFENDWTVVKFTNDPNFNLEWLKEENDVPQPVDQNRDSREGHENTVG